MYQMLIKRNIRDAFSSVEVLLCKYFTFMMSNSTGERFFPSRN